MKNLVNKDETEVESLPVWEQARSPEGWSRHNHDFPYNKIHRFLECRVGKLWNDVFSEFVHLDWVPHRFKTREQIGHSVVLNTFMKDGKVHHIAGWRSGEQPIEDYGYGGDCFYVHPTSGKLCYIRKKRVNYEERRKREDAKTMRILGDYHQLLKRDGIWHEVKGEPIQSDVVEIGGLHYREVKVAIVPPPQHNFIMGKGTLVVKESPKIEYKSFGGKLYVPTQAPYRYNNPVGPRDRLIEKDRSPYYWKRLNYDGIKLTLCRQLNSKELKKYGLTNDVKLVAGPRCKFCGGLDCKLNHTDRSRYA